ncbi:MAG: Competence protein [Candidatus Frackibacter sp. T328-2]|nr:MAG: Competence protein [Candidatus Frackibacter sp. T328-2]
MMAIEIWLKLGSMIIAVLLLFLKRKGMKEYLPVGMFASLYAQTGDYIAKYFGLWNFPNKHHPIRVFRVVDDVSIVVDMVVVPILVMFGVRYTPTKLKARVRWFFILATSLTIIEFLIERFTNALEYYNGYDWYHSYILWFISWFIWFEFHAWFSRE